MLSFCFDSSSTSRCAPARCRSISDLVSARSCSAWDLAWATIWSAFFFAFVTSCRECWSASRRVCSAWALALAARCSAVAARCSASLTSFWVADWAAASPSGSCPSAPPAGGGDLPLRPAPLQDALGLASHLVSLPLGGGEDLVALPLGGRLELSDLPLGGGAQLGDVPLDRGPLFRDLVVGRGPQLGYFPLGGRGQLVRLAPGPRLDRVGLAFRRRPQLVRLPLGVGPQFPRLVLGRGPHLRRVHLGRRVELVGRGPGLLRDLGGLLFGQPEQLLDPGTKTGVGGPFLLTDLPVSVGQFLLQRLNLLAVLAHLAVKLLEVFVDLMRVIAAHHPCELAGSGFFEEVAELGVDFRLHVA